MDNVGTAQVRYIQSNAMGRHCNTQTCYSGFLNCLV